MGRPFRRVLTVCRVFPPGTKLFACAGCKSNPLACIEHLMSKQFHSRSGRAYLFSNAYNITGSHAEERMMTTGVHVVQDIFCRECLAYCGWQYVSAAEKSQKYKEGKVILERACLVDYDKALRRGPPPPDEADALLGSSPDEVAQASLLLQDDTDDEEEL